MSKDANAKVDHKHDYWLFTSNAFSCFRDFFFSENLFRPISNILGSSSDGVFAFLMGLKMNFVLVCICLFNQPPTNHSFLITHYYFSLLIASFSSQ